MGESKEKYGNSLYLTHRFFLSKDSICVFCLVFFIDSVGM